MLDPRDAALQSTCPCLAVPRFGALPSLAHGMRVLLARDGVYVQVRLAWLDAIVLIQALPQAPPLPYGQVAASVRLSFGEIPMALLERFIDYGRAACPNELAGALIYSRTTQRLRLHVHESVRATSASVRYRLPDLGPDETIAVDLHTHGRLPAFWSAQDDADDCGIKIAGVFGNLDGDPSGAFRLVINGWYQSLPQAWGKPPSQASLLTGQP